MKRIILLIVIILCVFRSGDAIGQSQMTFTINKQNAARVVGNGYAFVLSKDIPFSIDSIVYRPYSQSVNASYVLYGKQSKSSFIVDAATLPKGSVFTSNVKDLDNYWYSVNLSTLRDISGYQKLYSLRSDMEADANEYVSMLYKYGLVFDDPYLESYLYGVVNKIVPNSRADGFPYNVKIVLARDESINACMFPNGCMVINTGLLSLLHTEDELAAVLSHEIGHFVANHSLVNLKRKSEREARAVFWSAVATSLAAVAEVAAASSGDYHMDGSLTSNVFVASSVIASGVLERMGTDYSKAQEKEADMMSLEVLKLLGYDKNAAATLFQRMTDYYNEEGNWAAYNLSGDHPSLRERIEYSGTPEKRRDVNFERIVSFAVTDAAACKYNVGRFKQALKLVQQNIDNNVGTDDDYLIQARCLLSLYNDVEHNQAANRAIKRAKEINPNNCNILRTEIIGSLREGNNSVATELLGQYVDRIESSMSSYRKESRAYAPLVAEREWARKMQIKVKGL